MNIITYVKNSGLKILYFICILFTINLILLCSKPIHSQFTDIAYMDFLLLFISLIFAFIDYKRWNNNYKGLFQAINKEDNIDASLPSNSSFEAMLMKDIVTLKNAEMDVKVQEVKSALEEIDVSEQLILEFNRIKFLINQVLYTSRATSYSQDLQINEVNIEKLVKEVVKRNSTLFISKNISLELGNINYTVMSDEKWLSYIIDQLINNGCKYVPKDGKINIYVKEENKVIMLYIKDNGIGIKIKDINRIFDRGFTGENGRSFTKSTGMGLYLSKKMAHKLSHDIYV